MTQPDIIDAGRRIAAQLAHRVDTRDAADHIRLILQALKIQEEAGEVAKAVIGAVGANPRKGYSDTWDDAMSEAFDVAVTAMTFAASLNPDGFAEAFASKLTALEERAAGWQASS